MKALLAAVRREPVRAYLYGLAVPGEALAVSYGLINDATGALWLGLVAALLLVPGVEAARQRVTPTADPRTPVGSPASIVPTEWLKLNVGGE